ncbi:MAG: LamG domain-containing protein [Verrucomicrobia bacterium]|nr:LamG domain-containing protein [Verrucomicrobiota bacterium]
MQKQILRFLVLICSGLAANSVSAQTLMEFNFNEGTGSTVTSSEGKLVGTFVGTPTFSSDSPSGLEGDFSMQFATGQRVTVPDPTKLLALDTANPHFTIQAWVKFATPTGRSVFFYNNGPGGAVSASVFTDRTAYVTTLGVKDQQSSATIPDDGKWHHMAVVHEAKKEFRFYIDGQLADTVAYTGSTIFTRTNQVFYIGAEHNGGLQYVGLLDRLRYSKGMLAPEQLDSKATPAGARPKGAVYLPPKSGWAYIFEGNKDTAGDDGSGYTSLDGTWSHDNGSDTWDGSKIGGDLLADAFGVGNAPGGVMSLTEGGVTFLRMQDTGNPTGYQFPDPYSNRKLFFGHDITAEGAPDTFLDDGVTLTFRARIPTPKKTTGPLDQLHRDGQAAAGPQPYPEAGDGYLVSDGGKGNVTIKQLAGGAVAFALTLPDDTFGGAPTGTKAAVAGLTMNRLNGTAITAAVDFDDPGELPTVKLDPTDWHEFWITIKADPTGAGNYQVAVYVDGSTQPSTFSVTAGDGNDFTGVSYLSIGGSRTAENWALDLDFVGYAVGAETPSASPPPTEAPKFSSIARQATGLVLTWTGGGTLQVADNVQGPYADVTGATSPQTVTLSGAQKFYRIKR